MTKVDAILEKAGGGSAQTIVEALGVYADKDFSGYTIEEAIRELPEGGGVELGAHVYVQASGTLDDFAVMVYVGDSYIAGTFTTNFMIIAAGTTVYCTANDQSQGTYQIGDEDPQPMEFVRLGVATYLRFTIPIDTPAETYITVDGNF